MEQGDEEKGQKDSTQWNPIHLYSYSKQKLLIINSTNFWSELRGLPITPN